MRILPILSTSVFATVGGAAVAAASAMDTASDYVFFSSTNCYIRQGTSKTITCVAKASLVDGETVVITVNGVAKTYEFDVNGTGVTAGNVQVNVSADTTAANVAARLKTAINANQATLTVTDPATGVLTVDLPDSTSLTVVENVANAGFTIGAGIVQASAASGSMFVPALKEVYLDGKRGAQLGVIQAAAGGTCTVAQYHLR